jgi:NADH:ubiquinone oxidoreductase subunit E
MGGHLGEEDLAIDIEATSTTSDLATVSPSMRQFSNEMAKHISDALEKYVQPQKDPLRPMRLLNEASEQRYEITSKMLANILEMKVGTIHSFANVEQRHGFEITKSGPGKWRVKRLEDEGLQAA